VSRFIFFFFFFRSTLLFAVISHKSDVDKMYIMIICFCNFFLCAPVNMDSEHAAVRTSHQSDGVKVYYEYLFLYFLFFSRFCTCTQIPLRHPSRKKKYTGSESVAVEYGGLSAEPSVLPN